MSKVKEMVKEDSDLAEILMSFNRYFLARSNSEMFRFGGISDELAKETIDFREFLIELSKIPKEKVITA